MQLRPLAALILTLAPPAYAANARVELVPELGVRGTPSAAPSPIGVLPLQLSPNALVPALSFAAPALSLPTLAPDLDLTPQPLVSLPMQAAAAKDSPADARRLLILSLAGPAPAQRDAALERERAGQFFDLSANRAPAAAAEAPAVSAPRTNGFVRLLKSAVLARPTPASAALDGYDRSGGRMKAALEALKAMPAGTILALDFAPTDKSLREFVELEDEVFLHRRRSDGKWLVARGDDENVKGKWADYDLALHNHPERRLGALSTYSDYPSPLDLNTAAGRDARFFVIGREGVVEWNSTIPAGLTASLTSDFFGRFVMRITFPQLYPTLLARRGVAAEFKPWSKVTTQWLESGAAPVRTKAPAATAALLAARLSAEAHAVRSLGIPAILDAYEDGSLAAGSPALNAALEEAGQKAMHEVLSKAKFTTFFPYGGLNGTYIYESPELPGLILKIYLRVLDRLGLPSAASRGYALAKAKLGGLFVDTAILENVELVIDGKRRRVPRALIQEKVEVKNVVNWGRRASETVEAMALRGVRETDLGPRAGGYEPHLARNLGETKDGRVAHFDADFFKPIKNAPEPGRRVPDPEPLRSAVRAAQRERLNALWAAAP